MSDISGVSALPGGGGSWDGTLMERMGMTVVEASAKRTVVDMPVEGNTQPFGMLHGGASAALAETAGSLAAQTWAASIDDVAAHVAAGIDLSITHLRGVAAGVVRAVAEAEYLGRSLTVHTVTITDAEERKVATARLTCRVLRPGKSGD